MPATASPLSASARQRVLDHGRPVPDLVDAAGLPTPHELLPGGDADPDRPHRWRDHDDDSREEDAP